MSTSGLDHRVPEKFLLKRKAEQCMRFEGKNQPVENTKPGKKMRWGEPTQLQMHASFSWSLTIPLWLPTSPVWSHPSKSEVIIAKKSWTD